MASTFGILALAKAIDAVGTFAIALSLVSVVTWPKSGSKTKVLTV